MKLKIIKSKKEDFKLMFSDPQFWVAVSFFYLLLQYLIQLEKY